MARRSVLGAAMVTGLVLVMLAAVVVPVWTFLLAPRAQAVIEPCDLRGTSRCLGVWEVDGQQQRGTVKGVARQQSGDTVPVRLGPLGAYEDDGANRTLNLGGSAVLLLMMIGAPLVDRRRARRPRPTGP